MDQTVNITQEQLEALLDRAARRGAREVLHELGLHDENASKDISEIRNLLVAWRDTKRNIWSTVTRVVTGAILIFIGGAVVMAIKGNISQ
jgi:hypothetical protein